MAITPKDRPGVEVYQEFRESTVVIVAPTLPACIVGPSFQVVEAVDDTGALVGDSLISSPARIRASAVTDPFEYAAMGGESLGLIINNRVEAVVAFAGSGALTASVLADLINTEAIAGLKAYVETAGLQQRLILETTTTGAQASLRVGPSTTAAVLSALGITVGHTVSGVSGYENFLDMPLAAGDYPDPRSNLEELTMDFDTVRVFVDNGTGSPREARRDQSFLYGGTSAVSVADDGDGDNLSPYVDIAGADLTASPGAAAATGNIDLTGIDYGANVQGRVFRASVDGAPFQTLTFAATVTDEASLLAAINALFGTIATSNGSNFLVLTSPESNGGTESSVRIDKDASDTALLATLGLTTVGAPFETASVVEGAPFQPIVGDELWADGSYIGTITEVPVAPVNRVRLDTERLTSWTASTFYFMAKELDNQGSTATRPSSELTVNENSGAIVVKSGVFRDSDGTISESSPLNTYLAYTALRKDVTPASEGNFGLLRYGGTTALEADLSPIDTQNPLGLGMFFSIINAPGLETTGLGVDETNDSAPEGTLDAYTRAFEYLESKDVYSIAPLTHDSLVGQVGEVHVEEMSKPENGLERILLINPTRPTRVSDTLVASGNANVTDGGSSVVATGIPNLQALVAAQGLTGPYTMADGLFLTLEGSASRYLVESIAGGNVTINNGPLTGNTLYEDASGSDVFADAVIDRPFSLQILGDELANLTQEATAYGEIAQGISNRRVFAIAPDKAITAIDGLTTIVEGYYLCCGLAGRVASKLPQQPLTEETISGFTGLQGSNDRYSDKQLKIMCGGGLFVFYHEGSGNVRIRQQLSTDSSSVEKQEMSITTALDFAAKFFRGGTRNFIGRFNITDNITDAASIALSGLSAFLLKARVLRAVDIGLIRQVELERTALEVELDIGVYYPLNKLRIRLVI